MKSSMMYFVISILGVLIFVGLTAYDTQKIKNMYTASDTGELMGKKAVMGALTLYLDFINLFIRFKVASNVGTSWDSFLYEFWY